MIEVLCCDRVLELSEDKLLQFPGIQKLVTDFYLLLASKLLTFPPKLGMFAQQLLRNIKFPFSVQFQG